MDILEDVAMDTTRPMSFIRRLLADLLIWVELTTKKCSVASKSQEKTPTVRSHNVLMMLLCLLCFANYCLRTALGTCAVSMAAEFHWDVHDKASLLSAFFWGYFCFNIVGAVAATKMGGGIALGGAGMCWSLLFLAVPLATEGGFQTLWLCLLAFGATEAPVLAASSHVIAMTTTANDRGSVIALRGVSLRVGQAFSTLCTPFLVLHLGWRSLFQVFGVFSVFAAILWISFGSSEASGADHSSTHLNLMDDVEIASSKVGGGFWESVIPLRSLRHSGTMVLIFLHCSANCVQYTLMSWGPTYCVDVLKMPLKFVGPALTLPVIAIVCGTLACGTFMDRMTRRGIPVLVVRRRVLVWSLSVAGVLLVPFGQITSIPAASVLLCFIFSSLGACDTAIMANYVDIAPGNTAAVVGVGNTIATLPGAMGPRIIAALLASFGSWSLIFTIIACILLTSAVLFSFFGVADDVSKRQRHDASQK